MQKENITKQTGVLTQVDRDEIKFIVAEAVGELAIITKKGFDGVYERLDKVEVGLDKVEKRLDAVEVGLVKVEVRLDKVEIRLDRVEDRLGDVEEGIDSFKRVWFNHEARIGKLETKRV